MLSIRCLTVFSALLLTGITVTGETEIETISNPTLLSNRNHSDVRFNHISSSALLCPIQFLNSQCQKLASAQLPIEPVSTNFIVSTWFAHNDCGRPYYIASLLAANRKISEIVSPVSYCWRHSIGTTIEYGSNGVQPVCGVW